VPERWARGATRGAAWLALAVSLGLTFAAWRFADAHERDVARAALNERANQLAARLSARMLAYEQLLRGAAGLFSIGQPVGRDEWRTFVGTIGLSTLPGIEGMGWAQRVPAAELGAHVEAMRRQGLADYRIHPPARADVHGPVTFLEPASERNRRAMGFDMFGEPVRRAAMQAARDSGRPSLTARVVLVQDGDAARRPGFLAYLPIYRPGAPTDDVEARRAALVGWVYAAFLAQDFVEGALGGGWGDLGFELRDAREGGEPIAAAGAAPRPESETLRTTLRMVDRDWELVAWPASGPDAAARRGSSWVALGGIVGSLLIFGIVRTLGSTRGRAVAIADRMTVALRQANESLEARVRERTASLRDTNDRLATVNEKLRSVNAAFGVIGAPGPIGDRLAAVAGRLRSIVPAGIALAVAFRAESAGAPAIGVDADASVHRDELERWRAAALESDRSGEAPNPVGGPFECRLEAPLLDAHGRTRGFLLLGRTSGAFQSEDALVLSQFALLVGSSLSLHETLARERHARAEAERADRAKEEMLAVVSHELRTPLNAIQGWLHVLHRRRADDDRVLLERAIEVIQRNLDTQVQLVDDLLDTARIVSGKLRLVLRPLDLVPVVAAATETVRPLAEARRIALSVSIANEAFDTVGDASRLEQVVWNLLTNAVKFTPPGGSIAVRLERIGWLAQLEVEDDGQGIDPSFLPHVFDRFRQADSSSTRAAGGLGLGLALVQHIVHAHGGQVMVRSEGSGRGTCFTVSLPLGMAGGSDWHPAPGTASGAPPGGSAETDVPSGEGAAVVDVAGPLDGMTVLVVEDHDDSRDLLSAFLEQQGARVEQAANSHEAMARVRALPAAPDEAPVLLCDIALPGENGYALLERIRRFEQESARAPQARLVALAISAFTRAEDRERSRQAGFVDHLSKPLAQADLVARLRRLRARADAVRSGPR